MNSQAKEVQAVYENADCLFTHEQVEAALDKMAIDIHQDLHDKAPVFLTVMTGGLMTMAGLLRRIEFPLVADYLHVTRYRGKTEGGELHWFAEPRTNLEGQHVLIVDDILDGGVTLAEILVYCARQGAASVKSAVLVNKQVKRMSGGAESADYIGLEAEDRYLFGYGLDYKEYLRNASGIYAVKD